MKEKMNFKKMLAMIGSLAIIIPGSLSVVACGSNETAAPKTELSEVIKTTEVDGNIANEKDIVLAEVIKLNSKLTDKDIEITDFNKATENATGLAKIVAKANSKYTGEVSITISKLEDNKSDEIIKEINDGDYTTTVNFKSSIVELKASIDEEFIKSKLSEEIANYFKKDLFDLKTITNDKDEILTDENFETVGSFEARIVYSYAKSANQSTKLIITVDEAQIADKFELNDGNVNTLIQAKNGKLYAGTDNGNIWEIDLSNNEKSKKYQLNNEHIYTLIQAKNGKLYAGTVKSSIWEINLEDNTVLKILNDWPGADHRDIATLIEGLDGKLYAGSGIGNVWEIDLKDLENPTKYRLLDWSFVNTLVQASNGKLYAGTTDGNLWEIDFTATEVKTPKFSFENKSNSILDMKEIADDKLVLTTKDKIYQFNLNSNEMSEVLNLEEGHIFSLVQGTNQEIYVATEKGNIYELDLDAKSIKNSYQLNASVYSLVIIDKVLYAGTKTSVWELAIV
ncbi:hypothetical protein [Spiroplasma platyhelix]|uniref:Lipoprotein n=1 Tax=Spiroplasma platyhelix PALS-1 TaxID=1276218 RepID=A0A846TXK4_9MOLU|nr:hypothetical protein [Spiroplasma platyhelix]MBE4704443.1 hypothetical protein [Spiroplasma platyhelix PALS-1]NKE38811.1 hypothetical protein [Spiroplasma platyhelix PALS-1]UJB29025.1 hypothetical protein SPLAT_v1c02610 [Spiroplasma platyhelix PALS-1]